MKKRLLSIVLALAVTLSLFASIPAGAATTRDPFQELAFSTYDDYSAAPAPRVWQNHGIYEQANGYWIVFKNVNFTSSPKNVVLSVYSYQPTSRQSGYIELRLDAPDGLLIAEVHPTPSPDWVTTQDTMVEITEQFTGVHDVYAVYRGTHYDNRVAAIRFSPTSDNLLRISGSSADNIYADAADEYAHKTASKLVHLGLMKSANDTTFGYETNLTVEEALCAAAKMWGMDFSTDIKKDGVSETGYFKQFGYNKATDFGKYVGTDPITTEDFVGLMLGVLGWNDVIEAKNSTVMKQATELKFFSGLQSYSPAAFVTKGQAAQIMENALEAKFLRINAVTEDGFIYDVITDEGIMSVYDNVFRTEGIVEHNYITSTSSDADDLALSQVMIDGRVYEAGNTDIMHAVGIMVDYYYQYDKNTNTRTILYYEELEGRATRITSEQLVSLSMSEAQYEIDDKIKTFKFNGTVPVLYNGGFAQGYSTVSGLIGDLAAFRGSITFVGDSDGEDTELIIIEQYRSVVLKSFNENEGIITGDDGARHDLTNGCSSYKYTALKEDGSSADMDLVGQGTVLDIATTHNNTGEAYSKIIVCDTSLYGEITETEGDYVYIDDCKYRLSQELIDAGLISNNAKVELGAKGTFLTDSFGYIRAFQSGEKLMAAIIVDYDVSSDAFESAFKLKLFTNDGEMIIADAAETLRMDADVFNIPSAMKTYMDNASLKGSVAIYRVNNKKQINMLDTIAEGKGGDKDQLVRICSKIKYVLYNGIVFGNTQSGVAAFNGNLVFNAPYAESKNVGDEGAYGVSTSFSGGFTEYDLYSTKGNKNISDLAVRYTESSGSGSRDFLVEKVKRVLDDEGNVTAGADGWFLNTRPEKASIVFDSITGYDTYFSDEIKAGDVIKLGYDAKNKVVNAGTADTVTSGVRSTIIATDSLATVNGTFNRTDTSDTVFWCGEVVDIVGDYMIIDTTGSGSLIVANVAGSKVLCHDSAVGKATEVSLNDIVIRENDTPGTGDKVLMKVSTFKAGTILIYN